MFDNNTLNMDNINDSFDMPPVALNVTIHQKRRGQGKKISQIEEGECIRVDKQKGKALHLEVTGKMAEEFTPECKVEVAAVDLSKEANTNSFTSEGIKLVSSTKINEKLMLVLKVHRNARCLVFGVTLASKDNTQIAFGHSVSINAHNNGKQNSSRSAKPKSTTRTVATKRKRSSQDEEKQQQIISADEFILGFTEDERPAVKPKLSVASVPSILVTGEQQQQQQQQQTFFSPWSDDCNDLSFLSASDATFSSPYSSDVSSPNSSEMSPYSSGFSSPYSGDDFSPRSSDHLSATEQDFGLSFDFLTSFDDSQRDDILPAINHGYPSNQLLPVW